MSDLQYLYFNQYLLRNVACSAMKTLPRFDKKFKVKDSITPYVAQNRPKTKVVSTPYVEV